MTQFRQSRRCIFLLQMFILVLTYLHIFCSRSKNIIISCKVQGDRKMQNKQIILVPSDKCIFLLELYADRAKFRSEVRSMILSFIEDCITKRIDDFSEENRDTMIRTLIALEWVFQNCLNGSASGWQVGSCQQPAGLTR